MDVLVCADEVTNPKPHPEPVEKAVGFWAPIREHGLRGRQRPRHAFGAGGGRAHGGGAVGTVRPGSSGGARAGLLAGTPPDLLTLVRERACHGEQ